MKSKKRVLSCHKYQIFLFKFCDFRGLGFPTVVYLIYYLCQTKVANFPYLILRNIHWSLSQKEGWFPVFKAA